MANPNPSFWDQNRLRKGTIVNYGWCGTCAIPQGRLQELIADKHAKLQAEGHACLVLSESKTLIWWCGEDVCNPANYTERPFYATTFETDGSHYIGFAPLVVNTNLPSKKVINSDIYHLANQLKSAGHTCLGHEPSLDAIDSYQWCGSDVCTKPQTGGPVKMPFSFEDF